MRLSFPKFVSSLKSFSSDSLRPAENARGGLVVTKAPPSRARESMIARFHET